jgi:uncharacterized membrane protein
LTEQRDHRRPRIEAIDLARAAALAAMAVYHFSWDLELFGYFDPGTTTVGPMRYFARGIASSFLFLVGVSLFLGHGEGIRWRGFFIRFAMVAGAALAITLVTRFAVPDAYIFFGILHQIAFASVAGLLFLRLPWPITLAAAAAVIAAPLFLRSTVFDTWPLLWTGLSATPPRSNDFVPAFPWFGAVLAGIAAARAADAAGLLQRLAAFKTPPRARLALLAGRHSLAFYLVHQPVLISLVWLATQVVPPSGETSAVGFRQGCEQQCRTVRGESFCALYCGCVLDRLETAGRLKEVLSGSQSQELAAIVTAKATECTAEADAAPGEGGGQ